MSYPVTRVELSVRILHDEWRDDGADEDIAIQALLRALERGGFTDVLVHDYETSEPA